MKRYKELRSNPDKNTFTGPWEMADKYKHDKSVFITFTDIDKVGINPQSKYNTPIGIYCYPLVEFAYRHLPDFPNKEMYSNSVGEYAPFAGHSKYVSFLKLSGKGGKFVDDMYKDYGSDDYDRDIEKLKKLYGASYPKQSLFIDYIVLNATTVINDTLDHERDIDDRRLLLVAHTLLLKYGKKTQEKEKDVFYFLKIYAKDRDKSKLEKNLKYLFQEGISLEDIIDEGLTTAKHQNPVTSMWNITRLLSLRIAGTNGASVMWNKILRGLGYAGFADRTGAGIIHPSEPMQAMFLTTQAFTVIERFENKPAKKQDIKIGNLFIDVEVFASQNGLWSYNDVKDFFEGRIYKKYIVPTIAELQLIRKNRDKLPDWHSDWYWSSEVTGDGKVKAMDMGSGKVEELDFENKAYVIAVKK